LADRNADPKPAATGTANLFSLGGRAGMKRKSPLNAREQVSQWPEAEMEVVVGVQWACNGARGQSRRDLRQHSAVWDGLAGR
jgi:hypothetical protein